MSEREPYRFGRFTLDGMTHELAADGAPIPLGSTAARLLTALVERAGSVVTKDELMRQVWAGSTVGDNALHVQITALRKALGDGFIATKQGLGYKFIEQVSREDLVALPRQVGNLPGFLADPDRSSRLVGRDDQLRTLSDLLSQSALVTLVGPGGVGKTRLALQAASENAARFKDGAWLVELAALTDGGMIAGTVATALGIKIGESANPFETLARQLARRQLLLVLDNCEQIVDACARLCEVMLRMAPGVRLIATSREALACFGEQVFDVPPLALPGEDALPATIVEAAAVELFVKRVQGLSPRFRLSDGDAEIAARLCRRVDGLPLAIEMVAGWVSVLGLPALEAKLSGSLNAWLGARRTAPQRHSTLRATLEWSHDLLSPLEQIVLRRLAAFAGAFSMAAAEAVVADRDIPKDEVFEQIGRLIGKSMIASVSGARETNYRLLETTRTFMLEKLLASQEAGQTRQRHTDYVIGRLRQAMREWETASDAQFLARYAPILDDLRSALGWTMGRDGSDVIALAGLSWPLWRELPVRAEGRRWLSAAVTRLDAATPQALEAHLRRGLGELYFNTAAVKSAQQELERAVALFRSLEDLPNLGSAVAAFGYAALMLGDIDTAQLSIAEALQLVEHTKRPRALAAAYSVKFCVEARLRAPTLRETGRKAVHLCEAVGADRAALVVSANLVEAVLETGDVEDAIASGQQLIADVRDTYHTDILGYALGVVSAALNLRGDPDAARVLAREAVPLLRDEGMLFWFFDHLALGAALSGRLKDAGLIGGYADALFREFGRPREPIGCEATVRVSNILRASLPASEIRQLGDLGAELSEDRIVALALAG